eukprot:TRINITY_DN5179_c0_g2_i3.p1 TRINITY_DN5179_c0_g2~~TRINITY_DN5179_c0_g2_i3.p1  ORF type:complete len:178 (+),score=24.66 TRINITY_DN5179_c0_g2_i3:248-781(+)
MYCTKHALQPLKKNKGQIIVISSMSGEIGLPWRTAYCSSKFAVTGFFEALRSEVYDTGLGITIICPPTVDTPMRSNDILRKQKLKETAESRVNDTTAEGKTSGTEPKHDQLYDPNQKVRLSAEQCVKIILEAADRRARKIYFPLKPYIAVYLRPFFPDVVDHLLRKETVVPTAAPKL